MWMAARCLALGLAVVASPAVLHRLFHQVFEYRRIYLVSGLRILAGGLLVVAGSTA